MNEEKYNYFIKICELGSITKAAETPTGFGGFDIVAGQRAVTEDSSTDTVLPIIEGCCQFT